MKDWLATFDRTTLQPISFALLGLCVYFFWKHEWLIGSAMALLSIFGVGFIGQSLHREKSFRQLTEGNPNSPMVPKGPIDQETGFRIGKAAVQLGFVVACGAFILSYHHGSRWYIAAIVAGAAAWLGPIILSIPFFIMVVVGGWRSRR